MAAVLEHQHMLTAWAEHHGDTRVDTELVVLNSLRDNYPGYHVTRTNPTTCDLLGFAAAGHATATSDHDLGYDATRQYVAPHYRYEKCQGTLKSDVKFGRWSYVWNDQHYLVYKIKYSSGYCLKVGLYVLTPTSAEEQPAVGAHHPVTDALLRAAGLWSKELHGEIYVFDNSHWTKDSNLWNSIQSASWDDVILDPETKATLQRDVLGFFDNEELYKSLSVPWKRGLILHGVPGNGKTITVKALIKSLADRHEPIPALYVKSLDSDNGPKWSISAIFTHARQMAPCLLIFEDLDSLVGDKTRSYFLNEVDGLDDNNGILMIGSTNHLNRLDAAITKRPSRFDRKYHFEVPDEKDRVAYSEFWRTKITGLPQNFDFPTELCPIIAKVTEGFSFAYLKELFMSAMLLVATGTHLENEHDDSTLAEAQETDSKSDSESAVVVDSSSANGSKESPGKTKGKEPKRVPRKLPEVHTPESLRDNTILRIVMSQAKTLLADMDNTEEHQKKKLKDLQARSRGPGMVMHAYPSKGSDSDDTDY